MTGYQGLLLSLPRHAEPGALRHWVELSTVDTALLLGGVLFAQIVFRPRQSRREGDPRARRARSTAASTGRGCSRAAADLDGLASRDAASCATTGTATTRPCWSTCSRSARRRIRSSPDAWTAWTRTYKRAGARSAARNTWASAAVRPPVFARLDRLPRHPGRVHARARHRLFREQPPRGVRAARVRDRQSDGLEAATARTSGASPPATVPPTRAGLHDEQARSFRHYSARGVGRAHDASTTARSRRPRRSRRSAVRAGDRDSRRRGMHATLRRAHLSEVRLPRRVQSELHLRCAAAATGSCIPGFGWVASDYSASTRARSWR